MNVRTTLLAALAIGFVSTMSAKPAHAGTACDEVKVLEKQVADLHALYGTLDNKAGAGRKPQVKADIVARQAQLDNAKKECSSCTSKAKPLEDQLAKLYALYGTLDNKAGAGRKPQVKADIIAKQAEVDKAKSSCSAVAKK